MRRDAREVVFKVLFSETFVEYDEELFSTLCAEADLNDSEKAFASDLINKVNEHQQELNALIGELAVGYSEDRVYPTDKCALKIGLAEIKYLDTPYIVAIDEALAICKKYSTEKSLGFVNGIFAEFVKRNKIA